MKIVIDISVKAYNALTHTEFDANLVVDEMRKAIVNGTPLPEHHGRLIDENDLKTLYGLDDRLWWSNAVEEFPDLPTIIEADEGSESE